MEIKIKFTNATARRVLFALQQKHGLSYNPEMSDRKFSNLIKLDLLTTVAEQARIDMERLEKLMPEIMADD